MGGTSLDQSFLEYFFIFLYNQSPTKLFAKLVHSVDHFYALNVKILIMAEEVDLKNRFSNDIVSHSQQNHSKADGLQPQSASVWASFGLSSDLDQKLENGLRQHLR